MQIGNSLLIYIVLLPMIIGCKKDLEKKTFYENGNIKTKIVFFTKKDAKSFLNYEGFVFYENGNIQSRIKKRDGKTTDEYLTYYEGGKLKSITMYDNDTINGIHKCFSKEGELVEESLFIDGIQIVKMKTFNNNGKNLRFYYFIKNKNEEEEFGNMVFDKNGFPDSLASFYYYANCKDTISTNDKLEITISVFTSDIQNYIFESYFGEFDNTFEVIDTNRFISLKSKNNHISFNFNPLKNGRNVLIGKIHVKNTDNETELLDRDFIFFKDFYVEH